MYDVITFGESMIRLTPPDLLRLEQTQSLEIQIGGSESNVAVGLARLGLQVGWVSRLTKNSLGNMIVADIRKHGVDTSHVVWTNEDRVGVFYLEEGRLPRTSRVIYDRANSAISRIQPDQFPSGIFEMNSPKIFHTSGITVALSESAKQTALLAFQQAKSSGAMLSFDVNYRSKLWTTEHAKNGCHEFIQMADFLFLPLRDAQNLWQFDEGIPVEGVLEQLSDIYPDTNIVMTLGAEGSIASSANNEIYRQLAMPIEIVDRVGGGDAFVAGFLYGYLQKSQHLGLALQYGTAMASLKYSIRGDVAVITLEEVEQLVEQGANVGIQR